jgi:hypothetical protein
MAIAALLATQHTSGWPRKLAIAGAVLSATFTVAVGATLLWLAFGPA